MVGHALPGAFISGLTEDTEYLFYFSGGTLSVAFIDDVPLPQLPSRPGVFRWRADFYAGRVSLSARFPDTAEPAYYYLDISPSSEKLGAEIYQELLAAIKATDQRLALGLTPATAKFGDHSEDHVSSSIVLLERLKKYGPPFLQSLRQAVSHPHRKLAPLLEERPLSLARRIAPSALRDPRVLLRLGDIRQSRSEFIDDVSITVQSYQSTLDTAANRTLLALINRFHTTLRNLRETVLDFEMGGEKDEQAARRLSRLETLDNLITQVGDCLKHEPFVSVNKPETSSAGLTQIAAQPLYSRSYRLGCQALRLGVHGEIGDENLPISPSWELYERWCFLEIVSGLEALLGIAPHTVKSSNYASAERIVTFDLDNARRLQVMYQARFPSIVATQGGGSSAWSISRERYPDIVVLLVQKDEPARFAVVDAKYRAGRQNILDAMSSAHIYRDALRIGDERAAFALLTLPGQPWNVHLDSTASWEKYSVGTASECRPGSGGIKLVADWICRWANS